MGSIGPLAETKTFYEQRSYFDYVEAIRLGPRSADDNVVLGILSPGGVTPATNPVTNNTNISISSVLERATGMTVTGTPSFSTCTAADGTSVSPDATITFNNATQFFYRTTATLNPGSLIQSYEYDFLSTVEHEINEALGIGSALTKAGSLPSIPVPLDLFRYAENSTKSSPVRIFTLNPQRAFFSIDGDVVASIAGFSGAPGTTPEFNNLSSIGDFNDWVNGTGVQDALTLPGPSSIHDLGPNEIRALDAIGYDLVGAATAAPAVPGAVTFGGVILSPIAATVDIGGTAGTYNIKDIINQNGLRFGFLSGVTDFDSYLNSTPRPGHTVTAANFEWFGLSNTGRITFDLGKLYLVDKMAIWEEENKGTGKFNLSYSIDGVTFASLAVGLVPAFSVSAPGGYGADVFSFTKTDARYIRLDMPDCTIPYGKSGVSGCSIGEVAFEVNPSLSPVASSLKLTPLTAVNNVGTNHTVVVTATSSSGLPAPGETVTVTILTGPNAGLVLTATTGIDGKATFTYPDTGGSGTDTIRATVRNLISNVASKTWATLDAFVEVCKASSSTNPVAGNFIFTSPSFVTVTNNSITVPVGGCSGPIHVEHGPVTIVEALAAGYSLNSVAASGYSPAGQLENRLVSSNPGSGTATVTAVVGNSSQESVVTFTNQGPTGQLKICKIAGAGVAVGSVFNFTVTIPANGTGSTLSRNYAVPAGPAAQGGFCVIDTDPLPAGIKATVTEVLPTVSAYFVSSTTSPAGATGGRSITVSIGAGFTQVTFTNSTFVFSCCFGTVGFDTGITLVSPQANSPSSIQFDMAGVPGMDFTATVTVGAAWFAVTPNRATTPATLTLTAAALPAGVYEGMIAFASTDRLTQVAIPVTYRVAALAPQLSIAVSHQGNFTQGQTNAAYTATVSNAANAAATAGLVTVTNRIPDIVNPGDLQFVSMSGLGWSCLANICTRSDALLPGKSYPPVAILVNVPSNTLTQWTARVSVQGGGSAPAGAEDVTTIVAARPTISRVANAQGESPVIAANTWVIIKGNNLAPAGAIRTWRSTDFANGYMPTQLDGVSVIVNGRPAYIYYISQTQVNVLTSPDPLDGSVQVQLTNNGVTSAPASVQARPLSPSFFVIDGGPYVAAQHGDGSPLLTIPAKPGETISIFANGFGATNTLIVSGSATQSGILPAPPAISIGGIPADVYFAGLVGPGLFQFNVQVPATLADGDQAITATYNGSTTQAGTIIAVRH